MLYCDELKNDHEENYKKTSRERERKRRERSREPRRPELIVKKYICIYASTADRTRAPARFYGENRAAAAAAAREDASTRERKHRLRKEMLRFFVTRARRQGLASTINK